MSATRQQNARVGLHRYPPGWILGLILFKNTQGSIWFALWPKNSKRLPSRSYTGQLPQYSLKGQLEILFHMTIFTRVNIALQPVNIHLDQRPHLLGAFGKVSDRQVISPGLQYGAGKPDLTFHLYTDHGQLHPIAVGDIKLFAKWSHDRWKSSSPEDRMNFRQVLAQINYYMRKRKCRYAIAIDEV